MSHHHNYINPAFCQQSEFYGTSASVDPPHPRAALHPHNHQTQRPQRSTASNSGHANVRVHRSVSMRSMSHRSRAQTNANNNAPPPSAPPAAAAPRLGPKPAQTNLSARYDAAAATANHRQQQPQTVNNNVADGFALVPLSDLPNHDRLGTRYAYVPAQQALAMRSLSHRRLARSQDDLDRYGSAADIRDSSFTSLPPMSAPGTGASQSAQTTPTRASSSYAHHNNRQPQQPYHNHRQQQQHQPQMHTSTRHNSAASMFNRSASNTSAITAAGANTSATSSTGGGGGLGGRLKPAFSTDFVANKSLILVDQKSQQRYAIVPTAEDEELVDANEEIIQMHNGRAHRYAVIPTTQSGDDDDDDDEHDGRHSDDDDQHIAAHDEDDDDDDGHDDVAMVAETCLSSGDFEMSPQQDKYATIKCAPPGYHQSQLSLQHHQQQQQLLQQQLQQQQQIIQQQQLQLQQHQQLQQQQQLCTASTQPVTVVNQQAAATQKLFEILSTPRKIPSQPSAGAQQVAYHTGQHSTLLRTPKQQPQKLPQQPHYETPPARHCGPHPPPMSQQQQQQQPHHTSTPKDFTPQKLYYDRQQHPPHIHTPRQAKMQPPTAQHPAGDQQRRTTAVVTPRLARNNGRGGRYADIDLEACAHDDDDDDDGDEDDDSCGDADSMTDAKSTATTAANLSVKLRRATATMGAVSLMLMLSGALNVGLGLYMMSLVSLNFRYTPKPCMTNDYVCKYSSAGCTTSNWDC